MADEDRPARRKLEETRALVASAAATCFEKGEPAKFSMTDIANAAGVSRQAAYRAFSTRGDLLRYVLNDRLKIIGASLEKHFRQMSSLEEALVECALLAVRAGRNDPLFAKILRSEGNHSLEQFVFRGSPEILAITRGLWGPHLSRAREQGVVNPEISDERFLDWIQQIEAVLSMRDDFSDNEQRQLLRDFLVPSIITRRAGGGDL